MYLNFIKTIETIVCKYYLLVCTSCISFRKNDEKALENIIVDVEKDPNVQETFF
jgi:hypothetical protein